MQLTTNFKLKKPENEDAVNIDDFNSNADILDAEVAKFASTTQAGRMTAADKTKLDSIQAGAQANAVTSVAGRTGAVVLTKTDVGLASVDNAKQATKMEFDSHVADSVAHISSAERNSWNAKASTAAATASASGLMAAADKSKLDGIAAGANYYVHPANHPASIITQDANNRFVTDAEKAAWNAKASTANATASAAGLMANTDKSKLDGIAASANNYVHPANHPPSIITQDASNRFVTDTEKATWNAKASTVAATVSAAGLMAAADKTKLDGIAAGAQVNRLIATQAQAEAGADATTDMTPQRTLQAIDSRTRYGVTIGTATALVLTLNPAPVALYAGIDVKIKLHVATGTSPTLNVNALGAKSLKDSDGSAFSGEAGKIYRFDYDGTNFILSSGGGGGKLNVYYGSTKPTKFEGVYLEGAYPINEVRGEYEVFTQGSWSTIVAAAPAALTDAMAVSYGNYVYVIGGLISGVTSSSALYRYDTVNNAWATMASLPLGRSLGMAVIHNEKIYVFGGTATNASNSASRTLYCYTISSNSWATLADMPEVKAQAAIAKIGSKVYIISGHNGSSNMASSYCYDIDTNTYTAIAAYPSATLNASADSIGTTLYVFSGSIVGSYKYDPVANAWSSIANNGTSSIRYLQATAINSSIYVSGGLIGSNRSASLVKYDPVANSYIALADMPTVRAEHVTAFANNRLYCMLGRDNSTYLASGSFYSFTSVSYPTGTLILLRSSETSGVQYAELMTPNKALLGSKSSMLIPFDDVLYHNGTTIITNIPTYIGNGKAWIKIK